MVLRCICIMNHIRIIILNPNLTRTLIIITISIIILIITNNSNTLQLLPRNSHHHIILLLPISTVANSAFSPRTLCRKRRNQPSSAPTAKA